VLVTGHQENGKTGRLWVKRISSPLKLLTHQIIDDSGKNVAISRLDFGQICKTSWLLGSSRRELKAQMPIPQGIQPIFSVKETILSKVQSREYHFYFTISKNEKHRNNIQHET